MGAIYKRELKGYFSSAIGYIVIAVFVFFTALFFSLYNLAYDTAKMTNLFGSVMLIYIFIIPIITMRTFADDKRQKTDQALLTAPVSLLGIVLGKYFAALTIYAIGVSINIIFAVVIGMSGTIEAMAVTGSIVGILLLGAALIAIGVFISNLTESQVIAAIATMFVVLLLFLIGNLASVVSNEVLQSIINAVSISNRFSNFSIGIFDLSDTIFYLSIAVLFNFFTVRMLEKRRWS